MSEPTSPAVVLRLPPALGLVLAVVLLGAVFLLSLPDDMLWQRVLEDAGHGPVFAGLAIILLWLLAPPAGAAIRSLAQYQRVFMVVVALGILTELLQWAMPNRNVSTHDVLHDAAGAGLGLAVAWLVERALAIRRGVISAAAHRHAAIAIALAGFVLLAWQPLQCARSYAARASTWPTLLPLGEPADSAFVKVHEASVTREQLPAQYMRAGDADSLRVTFKAAARPGLQLFEPAPDWRGKNVLVIDVTNPSAQPLPLTLRILDRTHDWTHRDRFNQQLLLPAATRSTVRIALEAVAASPRNRRMDMAAIADVMLFARPARDAGEWYVTRIGLE